MHLSHINLHPALFPETGVYPFSLPLLRSTTTVHFHSNITFFVGENGSGKSTLLKAITRALGIHIWAESDRTCFNYNPHEETLHRFIDPGWVAGKKPGAFFSAEDYRHMTKMIDEWASMDPGLLEYFGGKSLVTQSHGESFMAFFTSRYAREGIYLLDEPETALSPKRQLAFLQFLTAMGADGHAQFIIATHSPILLSCPSAVIFSFDYPELRQVPFCETEHFTVVRDFFKKFDSEHS